MVDKGSWDKCPFPDVPIQLTGYRWHCVESCQGTRRCGSANGQHCHHGILWTLVPAFVTMGSREKRLNTSFRLSPWSGAELGRTGSAALQNAPPDREAQAARQVANRYP